MHTINADTLDNLYAWVDQELADGLTSGTMVVRPSGRPKRSELLHGFLLANMLRILEPSTIVRHDRSLDVFSQTLRLSAAGAAVIPHHAETIAELTNRRQVLVGQWQRIGLRRWCDAAYLCTLGDLADAAACDADIEHCLRTACSDLLAKHAHPTKAYAEAVAMLDAAERHRRNETGYRIQRRCDPWLGGGIDDAAD